MTTTGSSQNKLKASRKPGRPRKVLSPEGHSRDIKLDILDATVSLIAQFGFDGFVLRDVADAVGVHTALVGYYFKTKQQLEMAALDRQISQLKLVFSGIASIEKLPPRDAIQSIFVDLTKLFGQGEAGYRFNRWTLTKGGQYAEELSIHLYTPAINLISEQIKKLVPEMDSGESNARALLLLTLAESCAKLKTGQLRHLKLDCDHDGLFEHYYRVIERQLIPEVCNFR